MGVISVFAIGFSIMWAMNLIWGNGNMEREFADINKYREELVGQTIESVEFAPKDDEGLVIKLGNGASLYFRFNGGEGDIFIIPDSVTLARGLRESLNK